MERDTRRISYVNCTIIAINVIYFLYLEIAGSSENTAFMISKGAMYAPLVLEEGQYYRLLTAVFMHFGINHIMNNMLVLFFLGDNLERALGRGEIPDLLSAVRSGRQCDFDDGKHERVFISCLCGRIGSYFRSGRRTFVCGDCKPRTTRGSDYPPAWNNRASDSLPRVYQPGESTMRHTSGGCFWGLFWE